MNNYSTQYTTIDIITSCYMKKTTKPSEIFTSIEIFDELLFWSRECNRERLNCHYTQQELSFKIDDIGSEVDRYLIKRRLKMLANGQKGKNNLFSKLDSIQDTIAWLVARWGNVFLNLATNSKYKNYIDAGSIGLVLDENMSHTEDALTFIIDEEVKIEYEREQKRRMKKWDNGLIKMVHDRKVGGESSESGRTQMVLIF